MKFKYLFLVFEYIEKNEDKSGQIVLYQDSAIRNIVLKHNQMVGEQDGVQGYRIRIFSDLGNNARDKAQQIQTQFIQNNNLVHCYIDYSNPNFRVLVGDFKTKSEALKLFKQIISEYPSAFIIKTNIKIHD